jgi:hypothetical protein
MVKPAAAIITGILLSEAILQAPFAHALQPLPLFGQKGALACLDSAFGVYSWRN